MGRTHGNGHSFALKIRKSQKPVSRVFKAIHVLSPLAGIVLLKNGEPMTRSQSVIYTCYFQGNFER